MTFDSAQKGLGQHVHEVIDEQISYLLKLQFAGEILFDISISFSKLSALVFYGKVFRVKSYPSKAWRWTYYIILIVTTAWPFASTLSTILQCQPVQKYWLPSTPGTCSAQLGIFVWSAVSSVVIDIAILIVPLPPIWELHLKTSRKLAIAFVFILGYS